MKDILLLVILFALTGCNIETALNRKTCERYGAVPGTESYINCLATLGAR